MTETPGTYRVPITAAACPFCKADESRVVWSSPLALAIRDGYPVSIGHTLVVPKRHVASWADLRDREKSAILTAIDAARSLISTNNNPDAFNIGFNDGPAAGQTVMHFHVHVIPRYSGDVPDPRGGIRWVLPDKAAYWRDPEE